MRHSLARRIRTTARFASAVAFVFGVTSKAAAYRCPQSPSPAKTATYQGFLGRVQELDGKELPYRLFVPENYDPAQAYPLVLYLHHAGLSGKDGNNESGWDNCVHLTSEIGSGDDYGGVFTHRAVDKDGNRFDTQERYPHFVLAPHAEVSNYGFGGGVAGSATGAEHPTRRILWAILEQVQTEFKIDPQRLYVTGISMGCYGTWDIIMRSPGVFAAAAPQSCRGDPNQTLLAQLKDMPIWSMCGTNDSYFAGAQAMANAMDAVGATAFTFTAMQGVGHSINDRGYDYPGFIDWMFAQRLPGTDPPGNGGAGGSAGSAGGGVASGGAAVTGGTAGNAGAPPQAGGAAGGGGNEATAGMSSQAGGAAGTQGIGGGAGALPQGDSGASGTGGTAAANGGQGGQAVPPAGSAGGPGIAGEGAGGASSPAVPPAPSGQSSCSIGSTRTSPPALMALCAVMLASVARRTGRRRGSHASIEPSDVRDGRGRAHPRPRPERAG